VHPLPALLWIAVGYALAELVRKVLSGRSPRGETDTLTGVGTRAVGHAALASLGERDAVAMIDLDTLKAVNDAHGHAAGDRDLLALASELADGVRAGDTVARWGGDEFVVGLRDAGSAGTQIIDRLRAASNVAFSAGVAVRGRRNSDDTLAAADAALLQAKRAGGARVIAAS
jgi:diguanylate cyclase (GGDEF)-like protein